MQQLDSLGRLRRYTLYKSEVFRFTQQEQTSQGQTTIDEDIWEQTEKSAPVRYQIYVRVYFNYGTVHVKSI